MQLADKLNEMLPVENGKVFFANSGSEANDSHMKMLRYYFNVTGEPQKKKIIALERSYHGVTLAAASLTGLSANHTHFSLPVKELGILRTDSPHYYRSRIDNESEREVLHPHSQQPRKINNKRRSRNNCRFHRGTNRWGKWSCRPAR